MINSAIGEWGLDNFLKLAAVMSERLKNSRTGTAIPRLKKVG